MSVYTISPCLFQCEIQQWAPIIASFVSVSHRNLKIALDRHGRAMDKYKEIPSPINREIAIKFLDLILMCNKYEIIDTGHPSDDELFLEICAKTVGTHEIIVRTKQAYPHLNFIGNNTVEHNGTHIDMYDKDEAAAKLERQPVVSIGTISDSIVTAMGDVHNPHKK